jgi:16S rRNA (guanine1516-N2)-methyltransferase
MSVALGVTTSGQADLDLATRAEAAARRWGVPFLRRRRKEPLGPMLGARANALVVFAHDGISLWDAQGHFRWSPGLALLRIKALASGQGDTLVRIAGLRAGLSVLDCTLGLGQDALVAAHRVGRAGRVVALEKSLPLFAVVSEGLAGWRLDEGACPIEVRNADSRSFLRAQPTGAFDVVLFDPMFLRPRRAQPAFEVLRRHADPSPLEPDTLREARRVAKEAVVVKAARYTPSLRALGLMPEPASRTADVLWARAPPLP